MVPVVIEMVSVPAETITGWQCGRALWIGDAAKVSVFKHTEIYNVSCVSIASVCKSRGDGRGYGSVYVVADGYVTATKVMERIVIYVVGSM